MKDFLERIKLFISRNLAQVITVAAIIALVCLGAAVSIYQSHRLAYPAVEACNLLTEATAKAMLGDKVNGIASSEKPVTDGDVSTSDCSYTDLNPVETEMKIAALLVMSPRNASGETEINAVFKSDKSSSNVQAVRDIGDSAFFNKSLGQLNVLYKNTRFIFSYGLAESAEDTTVEDQLSFAKTILAKYNP
ncbi:MAG: hypothetical protein L0H36_00195 [bacterium]|nr:hypothetical protein [bacterium]MDN5835037.1 hypothetical protein [bacterium]